MHELLVRLVGVYHWSDRLFALVGLILLLIMVLLIMSLVKQFSKSGG
jgi:hypothetical protein